MKKLSSIQTDGNMLKLSGRAKTLLSMALFVAVFASLAALASVYDLQISKILTQNALPAGEYLATDFFGVFGEIVGTAPVYLLISFCTTILFVYFAKVWKLKPLKYVISAVIFVGGVVAFWFFLKDLFEYMLRHAGNEEFASRPVIIATGFAVALLLNVLAIFACKNLKEDTIKKLCKFALVAIIAVIVANVVIALVKSPAGRMRFRAMNAEGDFSRFTAWYVMNGKYTPTAEEMATFGWAKDAFKSFPSGHTCAAGMTYAIMLLPDVLGLKKKGAKFACYAVPIIVTGLVAISRIVCGAHFFSDVLFGGTIAFLSMMIAREIFICKFSHIKAIFCKRVVVACEANAECVEMVCAEDDCSN